MDQMTTDKAPREWNKNPSDNVFMGIRAENSRLAPLHKALIECVRALELYKADEDKNHSGPHIWESAATDALQALAAAVEGT